MTDSRQVHSSDASTKCSAVMGAQIPELGRALKARTAQRDVARADADRLAAEVRQLKVMLRHWSKPMGGTDEWRPPSVRESLRTATEALAAHDALTAETE